MAYEANPRLVFERLFGSGPLGERQKNFAHAAGRAKIGPRCGDGGRAVRSKRRLGRRDQQKLDEYLTSVREIERRIQRMEQFRRFARPARLMRRRASRRITVSTWT